MSLGVPTPEDVEWWIDDSTDASSTSRAVNPAKTVKEYSKMAEAWPSTADPSPLLGFARDGYAIYGPYDEDGVLQRGMDYDGDLDECNGKTDSSGIYAYYLTVDPPFAPPCLKGEIGLFTYASTDKKCPAAGITNTVTGIPMPSPSTSPTLSPSSGQTSSMAGKSGLSVLCLSTILLWMFN